uniref:Transmembrane protein n=1 Tax=Lepeophtheirus salmonis TaxID=72036 RepID=A0A0K2TP27_LEPSM
MTIEVISQDEVESFFYAVSVAFSGLDPFTLFLFVHSLFEIFSFEAHSFIFRKLFVSRLFVHFFTFIRSFLTGRRKFCGDDKDECSHHYLATNPVNLDLLYIHSIKFFLDQAMFIIISVRPCLLVYRLKHVTAKTEHFQLFV